MKVMVNLSRKMHKQKMLIEFQGLQRPLEPGVRTLCLLKEGWHLTFLGRLKQAILNRTELQHQNFVIIFKLVIFIS